MTLAMFVKPNAIVRKMKAVLSPLLKASLLLNCRKPAIMVPFVKVVELFALPKLAEEFVATVFVLLVSQLDEAVKLL